jgi:hypothetical protein
MAAPARQHAQELFEETAEGKRRVSTMFMAERAGLGQGRKSLGKARARS